MKKELLAALTVSLLASAGFAYGASDSSSGSSGSSDSAMSSSSDSDSSSSTSSKKPGSPGTRGYTKDKLNELSADPKAALFQRMDVNKDGYLTNEELSAGKKQAIMPTMGQADKDKDKKVDITEFKNTITSNMLGQGMEGMGHGAKDTDAAGMQSEEVMKETEEHGGGPTMMQGGENAGPKEMTPEQTMTSPSKGGSSTKGGSSSESE